MPASDGSTCSKVPHAVQLNVSVAAEEASLAGIITTWAHMGQETCPPAEDSSTWNIPVQ